MQYEKKYDLIIFDCDGTLADSEKAHNIVLTEQLHALGLTHYTLESTMEEFMGRAVSDIVETVETKYNVRFPDHHWKANEARYRELLPQYIRYDETTRPLLETLKMAGQKIAIGSNGTNDNVKETIKAAGFDEFFDESHIFTFEMVKNPKPSPDLYLHVCESLHTDPKNAIVIEDTVAGATAGIEAGIDTVGYVGLSHRDNQQERLEQLGCTYTIQTMAQLKDIVFKINGQNGKAA